VPEECEIKSVNKHFAAFWSLEKLGIPNNELTDAEFIQAYIDSIQIDEDGRAIILYPFTQERPDYDSCRSIADKRLENLWHSESFTEEKRELYYEVIMSFLREGVIDIANPDYDGPMAFLPNRQVERQDADTTKIRPVIDSSVRHKNRRSFNANLEVEPKLNPDIMEILMRF
jgi:hypothetical protein